MSAAAAVRGWLRSALTENLALKAVALAASIGLFVIVRGTEDAQISVAVDVVALLPPPSTRKMLTSEIPSEVRVTVRGSRSVLNALRRDGLPPMQMDLRDADERFFYFEQEELELPAGASIVQIAPAAVPLTWVDRSERRVPIAVVMDGEVAEGHTVASYIVEPTAVLVRGAVSELNRLQQLRTEAVDLTGLTAGTHRRRVPLTPLPEHVTYVDTVAVVAQLVVDETVTVRVYDELEVAVTGGSNVVLRPTHVRVSVEGPRSRVADLDSRRVIPFVDVTGLNREQGAQPVPVGVRPLPDGLVASPEPSEVLVVPERRPAPSSASELPVP